MPFSLISQPRNLSFSRLSTENGLPQNNVNTITQDKRGFLWFGTQDGICRYDGTSCKVFRPNKARPGSLPTGYTNSIFCDAQGTLWIGSDGGGLARYNPKTNTFTSFRHDPADSTSIPNDNVQSFIEDRQGYLWIATYDGICKFKPNPTARRLHFTVYRHNPADPTSIGAGKARALCQDKQGFIWIAFNGSGLSRLDPTTGRCLHFRHDPLNSATLCSDNLWTLTCDSDGMLWIGTTSEGMQCFDPVRQRVVASYTYDPTVESPKQTSQRSLLAHASLTQTTASSPMVLQGRLSGRYVWHINEDAHGNLWVAVSGGGLNILDKRTGICSVYRHYPSAPTSLSSDAVRQTFFDRNGIVWIATQFGGVSIFDPTAQRFTTFRFSPNSPNGLSSNVIRSFLQDSQERIWIGTGDAGLNLFDPATQRFAHIEFDSSHNSVSSKNSVWSLCEAPLSASLALRTPASSHRISALSSSSSAYLPTSASSSSSPAASLSLWIGTRGGLLRFTPSAASRTLPTLSRQHMQHTQHIALRGTVELFSHSPLDSLSVSNDVIRCTYVDSKERLWVGTLEGGLNLFHPATRTFTHFKPNPQNPNSLSTNEVRVICEDRDTQGNPIGKLWIGTWGGGLNYFDPDTRSFTHYRTNPKRSGTLSNDIIRSMYVDKSGTLWVGTMEGLNKFDRTTQTFRVYREEADGTNLHKGLPNNVVYAILEDSKGRLWLSTNNGLSCFDPRTSVFRNYDVRDGLQSNEFNGTAALKARNGTLYFGGIAGFTMFHPDSLRDNLTPPTVVITDFKKFNKSIPLDTAIEELHRLEIPYSDNYISFEFTAVLYSLASKSEYKYCLEGFDAAWIEAGTRREATYTNLDPGTYRFRVIACNGDGVWNWQGASIELVVVPPWWMTWWFRTIVVVFVLSTGLVLYHARVRFLHDQAVQLERQVAERTEELCRSNEQLALANNEILRQMEVQTTQAQEIELANTQLHELNNILELRNHQLIELDNEKSEILGIAAHDLKNPLNTILNLASILVDLEKDLSTEERHRFLHQIVRSSERMFELIKNLLDIHAIERGGVHLTLEPCNVHQVLSSLVDLHQTRAATKNITLHYNFDSTSPTTGQENKHNTLIAPEKPSPALYALADKQALQQAVDNIISNAVKYTPQGTNVFVHLSAYAETVRIAVQDEGPGISESDQQRLFKKFARLSAQPTGGEHSTGLGLSIVKRLVEDMNGKVWCESTLGNGATFIVELPSVSTTSSTTISSTNA